MHHSVLLRRQGWNRTGGRNPMHVRWSADDEALLKKLWMQGETAVAIGKRLGGVSRSAVLGKVYRLRLTPAAPGKIASAAKPQPPARRRGAVAAPVPAKKAARRGKTLLELTNTCCRWPYRRPGTEHYFFCGVEEADLERGIPYCARHMKRAYLVPPPRAIGKSPRRVLVRAA
jgi:GcrA cell cycle regulator